MRLRAGVVAVVAGLGLLVTAVPVAAVAPLDPELGVWLEENGPLRVGWSAGLRPVSVVEGDDVTGGYAVDAWDLAAIRLGIELDHVAFDGAATLIAALDAGEIDVIGALGNPIGVTATRVATRPFAWVPTVLVGPVDQAALGTADLSGRSFTSLPGAVVADDLLARHPDATYVATDGPDDGLLAVAAGDIDLYFGPLALLGDRMAQLGLDLVPIGAPETVNTVQAWAPEDSRPAALAVAVRENLTEADLALLQRRWTGFTLLDPDATAGLPSWVLPGAGALVAGVLLLGAAAAVLRRRVAEATAGLRAANDGLEVTVATRTESLHRSNDDLRRFSYVVAHDIKGPLTAIAGLIELVGHDTTDRATASMLTARVRASALRLSGMLDTVLDEAVAAADGASPRRLDGDELTRWLHDVCGAELAAVDGVLEARLPEGLLDVDPAPLRRALVNLVSNATKYAAVGGLHVEVTLTRTDDRWRLVVDDDGPGIPAAMRELVFAAGERLVDDARGTGLGLAGVRDAVGRAGGTIELTDAPELGGARFVVLLPRSRVGGPAPASPVAAAPPTRP
jgi:signal transduction histidine kinase